VQSRKRPVEIIRRSVMLPGVRWLVIYATEDCSMKMTAWSLPNPKRKTPHRWQAIRGKGKLNTNGAFTRNDCARQ
jgi:hypothetical protein